MLYKPQDTNIRPEAGIGLVVRGHAILLLSCIVLYIIHVQIIVYFKRSKEDILSNQIPACAIDKVHIRIGYPNNCNEILTDKVI